MTPRVDKAFSDELLRLSKITPAQWDLGCTTRLFHVPHPKVLKAQISYQDNPQQEYPLIDAFMGRNIFCLNKKIDVTAVLATPAAIWDLLQEKPTEILLDFQEAGLVLMTLNKRLEATNPGVHQVVLPILLDYVFSKDLWGPQGKWTRFHQRLNRVFEEHELLSAPSRPGYYPLKERAFTLEKYGFVGDKSSGQYTLTLPWTFPLTAMEKLESAVTQEF